MSAPDVAAAPVVSAWAMYRTLVGVGLACGAAIVSVYLGTKPVIEANRAAALERAVFRVLPAATSSASFGWSDGFGPGDDVVAGYDEGGRLVGVAIPAQGMGYQDTVAVLYGYDPQAQLVTGLQVLQSRETPGLGDRVETDEAFQAAMSSLSVALSEDGSALARPVAATKPGEARLPGDVDTLSGATITSGAVIGIVGDSVAVWAPRVRAHLDQLDRPGGAP